jgi:DNA-binding MarR family transcriptional regulator
VNVELGKLKMQIKHTAVLKSAGTVSLLHHIHQSRYCGTAIFQAQLLEQVLWPARACLPAHIELPHSRHKTQAASSPIAMPTSAKRRQRAFDSSRQEAYLNLWRTYDRLRAVEDELFAQFDLTAQQYNALRLLRGQHPKPLATLDIARRLISRAPDITRLLDKLEQRSLIARQRLSANRRVVQVSITTAGLDLLNELDAPVRRCHEKQLGHLSGEQLAQLIELLKAAREPHEESDRHWT